MKENIQRNMAICYLRALGMQVNDITEALEKDKRNIARSLKRDKFKYRLKVEDVVAQLTEYNIELDSEADNS